MGDSITKYEDMNDREVTFTIDGDKSKVKHPKHYGGRDNPYEAIKVIEAWDVGFNLGNTLKYISRYGKKDNIIQDLEKALFYLDREIQNLKRINEKAPSSIKGNKKSSST